MPSGSTLKGLPAGFLPEANGPDNGFRPPLRRQCRLMPLIDGTQTAIEIERAILNASTSIYMAYWDLALDVQLQSPEANSLGHVNIQSLLFDAVSRGVDVRVFLTDADPLADVDVHRDSWSTYRTLTKDADNRAAYDPSFERDKFQVVCSLPLAEINARSLRGLISNTTLAALFFQFLEQDRLTALIDEFNTEAITDRLAAIASFADHPGLWEDIKLTTSTSPAFEKTGSLPRALGVGTHHIKLTIVDGEKAILGGSNINGRIVDNHRHDLNGLTHDINCLVEGDIVNDLVRFFQGVWNLYYSVTTAFISNKNRFAPPRHAMPISPATGISNVFSTKRRPDISILQLVRTFTGSVSTPTSGSGNAPKPDIIRQDIGEAYEAAITSAKHYIYIENQYFRWPPIADWIKQAMRASPSLNVIVVLPTRPEEGDDPLTSHALTIRRRMIADLLSISPKRVGFYTLQTNKYSVDLTSSPAAQAATLSQEIYVHSKLLIIDDQFALIGTANINGRSFRVDTEIGITWHHKRAIKKLRLNLWSHLLGRPAKEINMWAPSTFVNRWDILSGLNVGLPVNARDGFVVPLSEPPASALPPNPLIDQLDTVLPTPQAEQIVRELEPLFELYANTHDEKLSEQKFSNTSKQSVRNV